ALGRRKVKNWQVLLSGAAVLVAVAGVLVWSLLDRPMDGLTQREAPVPLTHEATSSPELPHAAATDSGAARRETLPSAPAPAAAPSNLDRLFSALSIYRPAEHTDAPDFVLPDVEGRSVRLRELRGKLVLLNFWATWCAPCRIEMPSMERLYQTFKKAEFALLAVSIDRQGTQMVRPFVEELKLTFPILLDQTMEVSRQYGLRGLPTTYLIDPEGRLIGAAVGGRDWHSTGAKALIAALLRQAMVTSGESAPSRAIEGK
ncbi:MAG: peroxiredoxin family protein, partial [Candidatus Entotheonellia bacterium]